MTPNLVFCDECVIKMMVAISTPTNLDGVHCDGRHVDEMMWVMLHKEATFLS